LNRVNESQHKALATLPWQATCQPGSNPSSQALKIDGWTWIAARPGKATLPGLATKQALKISGRANIY